MEPIWERFVWFERTCGELSSIQRAESRRRIMQVTIPRHPSNYPNYFIPITATVSHNPLADCLVYIIVSDLIDRFHFQDMWPATFAYRGSFKRIVDAEFHEKTSAERLSGRGGTSVPLIRLDAVRAKLRYPRPDINTMIEYQAGMGVYFLSSLLAALIC
jgi:hypothetical protein